MTQTTYCPCWVICMEINGSEPFQFHDTKVVDQKFLWTYYKLSPNPIESYITLFFT